MAQSGERVRTERARRWLAPLLLVLLLAAAYTAGGSIRSSAGLELDVAVLRQTIHGMGTVAPIAFFGIMVFRNFLALPSVLVLVTGGLLFGTGVTSIAGGAGIVISGVGMCALLRWLGRDALRGLLPAPVEARVRGLEARLGRGAPLVVAISTAHPIGALAPLHWAYGLTALPIAPFALVLALTAPLRAYLCASFGAALEDFGSPAFWRATALFAAVLVVPLAIPSLRRRILLDGSAVSSGSDRA
jgi:uncharacterized membrane protein YdjX (TVP38/TMEM64 family)